MTLNAKDFPRNILAEQDIARVEPDGFLHKVWQEDQAGMGQLGTRVLAEANRLSGDKWQLRPLLKKARLPRLAKALSTTP